MKTTRVLILAVLPALCFACGSHSDEQVGASSADAVASNPVLSPIVGYEQINLSDTCGSCGSPAGSISMLCFYGSSIVSIVTSEEEDLYNNYGLPCGPGSSTLAAAYAKYFANNRLPWRTVVFQDSSEVLGYLQKGSPVVAHTQQWGGHYVTIYGLVTGSSGTTVYFSDGASESGLSDPSLSAGNLKRWSWSTFLSKAAIGDYIGFVRTSDPRGYLDGASCTEVFGWAQDTAVPTTSISADLYYGGDKGATGATRVRLAADVSRSDLCTALGSCDHAFSMAPPRSLMDGAAHEVYAYGINTTAGAPEILLKNAPRTITCASPAIPSGDVKRALTSTTILTDWHFDPFLDMASYTAAELAAVPSGVSIGSAPHLVQVPGQAPVYVVDGTYRRHVINETSMAAWRLTSANVTSITATALDALTSGPDWPAVPLLAKSSSSATVYLLDVPLEASDAGTPDAGTSDAGSAISCSGIDLQRGASGATVSAFQHLLQADGYYVNEPVDGNFGSTTAAAVEGFQLSNGHLTVSGSIDSATCEALEHPATPKPVFMYVNPNATPTYDLLAMKASGVTDVFFLDTGSFTDSDWKTLLSQCQSAGLRLSAWEFMSVSASHVGSLASLGLNIHMDLEDGSCNGSVSCVTSYVQSIRAACPGKLFTVATMPDGADSALYYGQDYAQIAPSVDAICPMLYKGNYNLTDAQLTSDAALMQKEAPGKIWITMQTYDSDSDVVALSASSLLTDVNAITASANGVGFFRYGLVNFGLVTD